MFLGVTANVSGWNAEGTSCSLVRAYAACTPVAVRADTLPALQTMEDNPFADFVEIPEEHRCAASLMYICLLHAGLTPLLSYFIVRSGLSYCNLLCGVIRGALEQVSWRVTCVWVRDPLAPGGAAAATAPSSSDSSAPWEMRLTMVEQLPEHYPFSDD